MTPDLPPGALPRTIAGRYELLAERGRGPRAVIHTAFDRALERRVMLKLFLADAVDATRLRIQEEEVRRVARLEHPALTRLFDAGIETQDDGRPFIYLVTDFNDGRDLRDAVAETPLSDTAVAYLGRGLAEALAVLHEAGLVHGSIAPSNVLVRPGTGANRARATLTELEVGYLVDQVAGNRAGMTPQERLPYHSPELKAGQECRMECDVFALGATLAFALVGAPPQFTSDGRLRLPLSTSRDLARTLRAMTAPDFHDRPSARDAARRLEEFYLQSVADDDHGPDRPALRGSAAERELELERELAVLTREPRDSFDRITRLATRITGATVSFLSLLDSRGLVARSVAGLDIADSDLPLQPLCEMTIENRQAWAIGDVRSDPRTRHVPIPSASGRVTSYAAVPLVGHEGDVIGSLCVYTPERHDFTRTDLDALSELAAIAVRDLELSATGRRSSTGLRASSPNPPHDGSAPDAR